jgi:hypothetical protein
VLAGSAVWLLLAAVAWVRMPRRTLALLALVASSAVLSFNLYRSRNQVFGMLGLYIAAGLGLAYLQSWAGRALNDPHHHHHIERAVIVGLKRKYGMPNPDCGAIAGGESDRARP